MNELHIFAAVRVEHSLTDGGCDFLFVKADDASVAFNDCLYHLMSYILFILNFVAWCTQYLPGYKRSGLIGVSLLKSNGKTNHLYVIGQNIFNIFLWLLITCNDACAGFENSWFLGCKSYLHGRCVYM